MSSLREKQPHIYGALPLHYRQGVAIANAETPPTWAPEMANDPDFPYTLDEYKKDFHRWQGATKVDPSRHGHLLALAIGGSGRTVVDQIDDTTLRDGGYADFNDGLGNLQHPGISFVFRALYLKFPVYREALMLRNGMEFFNFTPRREEQLTVMFLRFDNMLDRANELAELDISFPFRTWMVLSLLRLQPRKWSEYGRHPETRSGNLDENYIENNTLASV